MNAFWSRRGRCEDVDKLVKRCGGLGVEQRRQTYLADLAEPAQPRQAFGLHLVADPFGRAGFGFAHVAGCAVAEGRLEVAVRRELFGAVGRLWWEVFAMMRVEAAAVARRDEPI